MTIPAYTATDEQVEVIRRESLARYGIPYTEAVRKVQEALEEGKQRPTGEPVVPAYEIVAA